MAVKPQKGVRSVEEFKTQLHRHGLKATRPRIAVHTVMMDLVHASPDQVVERFREAGVQRVMAVPVLADAFREVLRRQGDGSVCICGSLYLAGLLAAASSKATQLRT